MYSFVPNRKREVVIVSGKFNLTTRDIFGFLKNCIFGRILGKKGQKMSKKIPKNVFSTKSYFLPIFENIYILCHIGGPMIHLLVYTCVKGCMLKFDLCS